LLGGVLAQQLGLVAPFAAAFVGMVVMTAVAAACLSARGGAAELK
jgi:hypothetical protein